MTAGEGAVLRIALRAGRSVCLREPNGRDEDSVAGRTSLDAIRLVDRLLVDVPSGAAALPVVDRDLVLAAVYERLYGPRIATTIDCSRCATPFDLDFQLPALVEAFRRDDQSNDLPLDGDVFRLPSGCRFRLPTGADEEVAHGLPEEQAARALLERCLVDGDLDRDAEAVLAAMERVGAGIDRELRARCPECTFEQTLRFEIQDYLLGAIASGAPVRVEEIHVIAQGYGWSLEEILSLSRKRRQAFVALLLGEAPRAWTSP